MSNGAVYRIVESEIHQPGRGLALGGGIVFLTIGVVGMFAFGRRMPGGFQFWVAQCCAGAFALMGAVVAGWAVATFVHPARVRHASRDLLPDVPADPVLCEGWTVHGRLTHVLSENAKGCEFQPADHLWRNDKTFLLGFGIPFLSLFAGLLTWVFHEREQMGGWAFSAVAATLVTLASGGTALVLIALLLRASYRQLCRLSIPADGDDLELAAPERPPLDKTDLNAALNWLFVGKTKRYHLAIPRNRVAAVQLCPWKYVVGRRGETSSTWAVQGLLVLSSDEDRRYHRVPLLLTSDFAGGARLMGALAGVLQVPYLFHANVEGWKAEERRARNRPPLKTGGIQS